MLFLVLHFQDLPETIKANIPENKEFYFDLDVTRGRTQNCAVCVLARLDSSEESFGK